MSKNPELARQQQRSVQTQLHRKIYFPLFVSVAVGVAGRSLSRTFVAVAVDGRRQSTIFGEGEKFRRQKLKWRAWSTVPWEKLS
jgi:hypothetical protein